MVDKQKICILTSVHPALDVRVFYKEAITLVKAGYDITLIAQHPKNEILEGIKIIALGEPKNRFIRIFRTTCQVFWLAKKQQANVYHLHDPELIWVGLVLKMMGKRVIYDVHEDYPKAILSKPYLVPFIRKLIAIGFSVLEKTVVLSFNWVITAIPDIQKRFNKSKSQAIKNFPVCDNFMIPKLSCENSAKRKPLTLIYAGGITKIRGVTQMIQALEYLDSEIPAQLKLLGNFHPTSYGSYVHQLNGFKKVDWLGWVPFERIPAYLAQADIGIACFLPEPNHINSMPNKLFEYMAVGLPVITSNFPLWKEIVEGNKCGLTVNPLDPKEIATAIEWLIAHPEEAKKMGANGRRAVFEQYNWENESKKLSEVYKELLS